MKLARSQTASAKEEHGRLEARLAQFPDLDLLKRENAERQAELVSLRVRTGEVASSSDAVGKRISAFDEGIAKLERDVAVDISKLVDDDRHIALQRAELEALEKEYLLTEQQIFSLKRDVNTVSESNAELLKICDGLMKKIETGGSGE